MEVPSATCRVTFSLRIVSIGLSSRLDLYIADTSYPFSRRAPSRWPAKLNSGHSSSAGSRPAILALPDHSELGLNERKDFVQVACDKLGLTRQQSLLGLLHGLVDLIEAVDREKPLLNLVNLNRSRENVFQIEIPDLATFFDHVGALAVRTDDAAAVNFYSSTLPNQPEFNGVPKQAAQPFQDVRVFCLCANAAIVLKE